MTVKAGYKIERDGNGLTANERAVLKGLLQGKTLTAIGIEHEVSRARSAAIAKELVEKGWLVQGTKRGQYLIETKRITEVQSW